MKTEICDMLDIEIPLLAFSHCRDVVAAVTNAGGFGVLGASSHTPEALEQELAWIDSQVKGRPYGADILVPEHSYSASKVLSDQIAAIPPQHRAFVEDLLRSHDIEPQALEDQKLRSGMAGDPAETGKKLLDVTFTHPVKFIANALGVPPAFMIEEAKTAGVPIGALVGAKEHAIRQVEAGIDVLIAQGTEAGGHCGEVSTLVLVPEVLAAIKPIRHVPVLAAGGIVTGAQMAAAVALGAAGAWTGSVWLTTTEAETAPATVEKMIRASSRDTVRSAARTGKPSRQLKSAWTEAWKAEESPATLPMPLQGLLSEATLRRIDQLAEGGHPGATDLATYWVGQGVGLMNKVRSVREVVHEMAEDYIDAVERLSGTLEG